MLSRTQATALLAEYGAGLGWTAHCVAVAQAAERVAIALSATRDIDVDAAWCYGLLHDIGRHVTHDPVMHGVEGHRLLLRLGQPDAAHLCAAHILFGLTVQEAREVGLEPRKYVPEGREQELVPLVDFMIEGDRPTTLEARFTSLRQRNADNTWFVARLDRALSTAHYVKAAVEQEIGSSIDDLIRAE